MSITKVWIDESENECILCAACEASCPEVFEVLDKVKIKPVGDYSLFEAEIMDAANNCAPNVIKYE